MHHARELTAVLVLAALSLLYWYNQVQRGSTRVPGVRFRDFWDACIRPPPVPSAVPPVQQRSLFTKVRSQVFGVAPPEPPPNPTLNAEAGRYVGAVYGDTHLPKSLRAARFWLSLAAYGLFGVFLFMASLRASGAPLLLTPITILFMASLAVFLGNAGCVLYALWLGGKAGVSPFSVTRADPLLAKLRGDVRFSGITAPLSPAWWAYATRQGVLLEKLGGFRLLAAPVAGLLAVGIAALVWSHVPASWFLASCWLLTLAWIGLSWMLSLNALIKYGDWSGAEHLDTLSFPLAVLLEDLE